MRKVRIFEHVSLDGVMQSPGGRAEDGDYALGGWTVPYRSPAAGAAVVEAQGTRYDLLLGRRTYDIFAGFWPQAPSNPVADGFNAALKYVATHRPDDLPWGPAAGLGTDIVAGVRGLKAEDGPDLIVWGSSTLTHVLFEHELVDEVVLIVYPVVLGQGKRLFAAGVAPRELALVTTKALPLGVLWNTYRVVGPLQAQPPPT